MNDIKCVVCGEPWNAWGVDHGDMEKWEAELFRKGAGCPCCKGEVPEGGGFEPEGIEDLYNGDRDPAERINAWEIASSGAKPEWNAPEPKLLWECTDCGLQAFQQESGLEYVAPLGSKVRHWYLSHKYWKHQPENHPAHTFSEEHKVCEFCLEYCAECGKPLAKHHDNWFDIYDEGYPMFEDAPDRYAYPDLFCIDCYEKRREEKEEKK